MKEGKEGTEVMLKISFCINKAWVHSQREAEAAKGFRRQRLHNCCPRKIPSVRRLSGKRVGSSYTNQPASEIPCLEIPTDRHPHWDRQIPGASPSWSPLPAPVLAPPRPGTLLLSLSQQFPYQESSKGFNYRRVGI